MEGSGSPLNREPPLVKKRRGSVSFFTLFLVCVFAVRQAPPLAENLRWALLHQKLVN
jgi:hypothetical protein